MADGDERARRRLKGFALHLMGYFLVVGACAVANFTMTPEQLWFIWPMVGWGAPLALHAAWVIGLFDGMFGEGENTPPSDRTP